MQDKTNFSERLTLKPAEAAEVLNISLPTMYKLCRREDFPKIRFGRMIVIPCSSLEKWIETQATHENI